MNKKEAFESLKSPKVHERLKAARLFSKTATAHDRQALVAALQNESVSWIRSALVRALKTVMNEGTNSALAGSDEPEISSVETYRELYANAVEEVTSVLVHEIEPIVGVLRLHAVEEIADFEKSKTKKHLDRLEALIEAMATYRRVAATPQPKEFDLSTLIDELIDQEQTTHDIEIQKAGPSPFLIESDRSLLGIAIGNGIRNALEAMEAVDSDGGEPVIINWGETNNDFWVAILDRGPGLAASQQHARRIGTSSKRGHLGMGLPAADQAISSLDGELSLTPREPNGTRFQIQIQK